MDALAFVASFAFSASPVAAQRWQVDLGGMSVRYDSTTSLGSGSLASEVEWVGRRVQGGITGSIALMEASQWSGQGRGDIALLWGSARDVRGWGGALVASTGGSLHSGGYRTGTARGELRLQNARPASGLWIGLAGATGWSSSGGGDAQSWGPTAGFWTHSATRSFAALAAPFRLNGSWFPELDAQASFSLARVDLVGYAGWRGAPAAAGVASGAWAGAAVTWWLVPRAALVLSGGSYPSDLLQALPGGRYLSLAIRVSSRRVVIPSKPFRQLLYVDRPGETELRFRVPGATRVQLAGDWTSWQPVPMTRAADGRWVVKARLGSGVHRFNLIVNGEKWVVPEGFVAVDDGFGGQTALVVVP